MELKVGDMAPDFSLPDQHNHQVSLRDFKGKKIILYFYPKDLTPGCTIESCGFQKNLVRVEEKDAVVLGVSCDSIESHKKFASKYNLKFSLLSDSDGSICEKFNVLKKSKIFGALKMRIIRTTFLIDEKYCIYKVYPNVKVLGHVEDVLSCL